MTVTYKIVVVEEPITSISYSDEYGYYVGATDVENILDEYMNNGTEEYDHIFISYKLGEELHEERIRTGDWIGLRRNDI